jgi:predicted nuclease of predicted toxin-antitoxin system
VLVSADTDFGELLATSAAELPSVILLRQSDRTVGHQTSSILANLDQVAADLDSGAVVTLAGDRVRVRRLPIR